MGTVEGLREAWENAEVHVDALANVVARKLLYGASRADLAVYVDLYREACDRETAAWDAYQTAVYADDATA
jgi:hypothetical protein